MYTFFFYESIVFSEPINHELWYVGPVGYVWFRTDLFCPSSLCYDIFPKIDEALVMRMYFQW